MNVEYCIGDWEIEIKKQISKEELVCSLFKHIRQNDSSGVYLYEDHRGYLYHSYEYKKDTYCELCGDEDIYIGYANSEKELIELLGKRNKHKVEGYIKELRRMATYWN